MMIWISITVLLRNTNKRMRWTSIMVVFEGGWFKHEIVLFKIKIIQFIGNFMKQWLIKNITDKLLPQIHLLLLDEPLL